MSDFENKLRSRKFLLPPAAVRDAVLASCEEAQAPWPQSWREWLWPSPLAWGAVTAVLLGALAFNHQVSAPKVPAQISRTTPPTPSRAAAYAFFQERQDLASLQGTH
jgi:hypothetical protein